MAIEKKTEFPFMGGDFAKSFGLDGDFAKKFGMTGDFAKGFGDMKMPGIDMEGLMSLGRRNMEALAEANKVAAEGFQAVARRQAEIVRDAVTDFQSSMKDMMANRSPEGLQQRQADMAKKSIESAVANAREIAEMSSKANAEVFDVINKRFVESVEELKALAPKA